MNKMLNQLVAKELEIPSAHFSTGEALYILFQIYIGRKKFVMRKADKYKRR